MNGFGVASWTHLYQEAFQCLRPGGWVENQEFDCEIVSDDNTLPADSKMREWARLWNQGVGMIRKFARCHPETMVEQMEAAGFVNTRILEYKMPIGQIGRAHV